MAAALLGNREHLSTFVAALQGSLTGSPRTAPHGSSRFRLVGPLARLRLVAQPAGRGSAPPMLGPKPLFPRLPPPVPEPNPTEDAESLSARLGSVPIYKSELLSPTPEASSVAESEPDQRRGRADLAPRGRSPRRSRSHRRRRRRDAAPRQARASASPPGPAERLAATSVRLREASAKGSLDSPRSRRRQAATCGTSSIRTIPRYFTWSALGPPTAPSGRPQMGVPTVRGWCRVSGLGVGR